MAMVSDQAICLRKFEYSETSQILTLFTRRHGLVRVIAKGAHRATKAGASKFDGGVDLLDQAEALFTDRTDRELNTLAEWKITEGRRGLRRSSRRIYLGLYLAELVSNCFELLDPHPRMFATFMLALDQLSTPSLEEAALSMSLEVLRESGFLPSLTKCAACGASMAGEKTMFFSSSGGGVICPRCGSATADRKPIDPRLIGIAITILRLPRQDGLWQRLPRLTRHQTDPLHALIIPHVQHATDREIRLRRFVLNRK